MSTPVWYCEPCNSYCYCFGEGICPFCYGPVRPIDPPAKKVPDHRTLEKVWESGEKEMIRK